MGAGQEYWDRVRLELLEEELAAGTEIAPRGGDETPEKPPGSVASGRLEGSLEEAGGQVAQQGGTTVLGFRADHSTTRMCP